MMMMMMMMMMMIMMMMMMMMMMIMLIPSEYTVPENVVNKIVYETDPEQERCATKRVQSGIHGEAMAIGRDFRGTSENIGSSEISKIRNPVKNLRLNLPDGM